MRVLFRPGPGVWASPEVLNVSANVRGPGPRAGLTVVSVVTVVASSEPEPSQGDSTP
jgi:hypothetical protein